MPDKAKGSCEEGKFVRHAGDESSFTMADAFACASCGVKHAVVSQRNFKVHFAFALLAVLLGFLLRIPQPSWLAVVLCIIIVLSLEMLNTAVESIVDLASPEWNMLAKIAKDCAAGSVFVAAIGSLVVAAIVYVPPLWALLAPAIGA